MVDSIRVFDPGFRVTDTSGNPVSGAKIKFYNAGTLVARTVYSDADLSVSLGSTVTCDSAGMPAADGGGGGKVLIYVGITPYKIVITDSTEATTIFEDDDVTGALDTSAFDADTALPRTPVEIKSTNYTIVDADRATVFNVDSTGGNVQITLPSAVTVGNNWRVTVRHTGTANSVTISASGGQTINGATSLTLSYQYESVTLVSDGANWHVTEDAFVRYPAGVVLPQGYLTPTSGSPIITGDVTAASTVYYTPFVGNLVPLYSGTRFVPYEFSQLSLTLVSQHLANTIYDVFAFLDGSTLRIGTGPAWATSTGGAGARGSGAGTTELTRISGVHVNAVSMTARNGTDTYTVAINKGTYLGSLFINSTAGQVTCHRAYGQSRRWAVWNAYNRRPIILKGGDSTASWTYNTATIRASNADAANSITVFCGLAEEVEQIKFTQNIQLSGLNAGSTVVVQIGIGKNSTAAFSGTKAQFGAGNDSASAVDIAYASLNPSLDGAPFLGINTYTALENVPIVGTGTKTFLGGEDDMLLTARWMG